MTKKPTRPWTTDELTIALYHYCRIPFGKLHRLNPEIIALAANLGRTPSAVAMKLSNFASFDPTHHERQVKGLQNTSKADREIWERFSGNWTELAVQGNALIESQSIVSDVVLPPPPATPTETTVERRVRLVQGFFREAVLSSYGYQCGICSLKIVEMLNASHVVPWSVDEARRADPTNGISLCAFHDRAFDRGFISIDNDFTILLAKLIHKQPKTEFVVAGLLNFEGRPLILPDRFRPDPANLEYHRVHRFDA